MKLDIEKLLLFFVWHYNGHMQIVNYPEAGNKMVGASGTCPHCKTISYFKPVATTLIEKASPGHDHSERLVNAVKCENCKKYALVTGTRAAPNYPCSLENFYPLGTVDDKVPKEVEQAAPGVAEDFKEALRCHWIKAYRASVVMCRRALQNSAIALGATGNKLIDQIDNLRTSGTITEPLRQFAHVIRLTGNEGAHPDKDGLKDVTEKDSTDIIEFTREYLDHVYVMPAKMNARKSTPPTPPAAATAP